MSAELLRTIPARALRWKLGIKQIDASAELLLERMLFQTIDQTPEIDAIALLAFDSVFDRTGESRMDRTHFHVTND